jgi:hypothetical protein
MRNERVVVSLIVMAVGAVITGVGCGERTVGNPVHTPTVSPSPSTTATATLVPGQNTRTPTPEAPPLATGTPTRAAPGLSCGVGQDCASGNCVDGVCCDTAACPDGQRCDIPVGVGQCSPPLADGEGFCWLNAQCVSGFCVDSTCCTVAACAQGESCGVFGHQGTCTALPTATVTAARTATTTATRAAVATPTAPPSLGVSSVAGKAGERVTIAVTLYTSGAVVAGAQNDLHFDGMNLTVAARPDGSPDCTVDPAIHKDSASFAFFPHGCAGAACTSVRALVFALDNVDPIADGSVLYTCNVDIAAEAPDGVYAVTIDNITLSDPHGNAFHGVGGALGQVFVGATPTPTFTWTPRPAPTRTAIPTATAARPAAALRVSNVTGEPGERVTIAVSLFSAGAQIAGTENDLHFDGVNIAVAARDDGTPDCTVEPATRKNGTAFAFVPYGCVGAACTGVRALVFAFDNVDPIADGSVLYSCTVAVALGAPNGSYAVTLADIVMSDPQGHRILGVRGVDGQVIVGAGPPAISLSVGQASPGTQVSVSATLQASGALVAGTQNDIAFDPKASIAAKTNGTPDCVVNMGINKAATDFTFHPTGCGGAGCTSVRALVLAIDNIDPIPDGAVLYTCNVKVADDASGFYPLTVTGLILSDPNGVRVPDAVGIDGAIVVQPLTTPQPSPTRTPTPTATFTAMPTFTPTPAPSREMLYVDTVVGSPGQQIDFTVMLHTLGFQIAGTQNDLMFDSTHTPIAARANGRPNCTVNADIDKSATSFAFRPTGCSGAACNSIRVLVLATDNTDPIPDGSVLYTCVVNVAPDASGRYSLAITGVIASTPDGTGVPGATGVDGAIVVASQ